MLSKWQFTWTNYLSISMVILAVMSTICWYKDSGHSTNAILSQTEAGNNWNHYQAKSLKSYLYETTRDQLRLAIDTQQIQGASAQDKYKAAIEDYQKKIDAYSEERNQLMAKAKLNEQARDVSLRYSGAFGLGMMLLQIAIVFGSLASLFNQKLFFIFSLILGCVGAVYFANGWFLFF